ncbi:MAG TPA: LysM peptidoglycan-binding domain-containing protein [Smithella sp.]|nr:LysM peptidoglycan-binding domain-containing protein [Smithella sp.]HRS97737.1 LysM peptidoglycan-binding domain-containing protein [Smithella sp.]
MIKKESHLVADIILMVILLFPLSCLAQNSTSFQYPMLASADVSHPMVGKETQEKKPLKESSFFSFSAKNTSSDLRDEKDDGNENGAEEKRELMEKALELLEDADKQWNRGDIDGTLETLDEAYGMILDANGDVAVSQEKDDLRLLIAQKIMAVYSSKRRVINGKNSEIPLIMNADVQKEINSFQGLEREHFIAAYQRSGLYKSIIQKELKKAGMPEELFWLPLVESFFKVNAYSSARALGLWQFIPSTGYKFGLNRDEWIDERMDVQKSTKAAIAYLKELHSMFGDWLTALAAYNCGEGKVLRTIARQQINYLDSFWDLYRQLPNETARYVPRFLATLHIVKDPQKYGFSLDEIEKPVSFETVKVNKMMKLQDIAEKLEISEETLCLLNPELRYKMTPDREYDLKIPEDRVEKFNLVVNDIPQSERPRVVYAKTDFIRHRVKSGETLSSIARRYHVSSSQIKAYNRLRGKRLVRGSVIRIPVSKSKYYAQEDNYKQRGEEKKIVSRYRVKRGDTLFSIARRFDVSVEQVKRLNKLKSNSVLTGQVLRIPSGKSISEIERKQSSEQQAKAKINKQVLSAKDLDKLGTNKYIVVKGDNLYSIARKNDINVSKLMELNNISLSDTLVPGQILTIR